MELTSLKQLYAQESGSGGTAENALTTVCVLNELDRFGKEHQECVLPS